MTRVPLKSGFLLQLLQEVKLFGKCLEMGTESLT